MKNKYEIALVLMRDKYIDLSTPQNLFDNKRPFKLYKWDPTIKYTSYEYILDHNENGQHIKVRKEVIEELGGWREWLHFSGASWRYIKKPNSLFGTLKTSRKWQTDKNKIMMKAHMFWETEEDFAKWVGEDMYSKMVLDLL